MVTFLDIQDKVESIDTQIVSLLSDRAKLHAGLDPDEFDADLVSDIVSLWIDEAAEFGLNEVLMEKIARLVVMSSKKLEE